MKKITKTKTDTYYLITEEEARYLWNFLGQFSDSQIAEILRTKVDDLQDSAGNSLHYYLWSRLDEEFDEELASTEDDDE